MVLPVAVASLANNGPHGLSEIFMPTPVGRQQRLRLRRPERQHALVDVTTAIAMVMGRFGYVVPVMAIAGSIAAKKKALPSAGTFPTESGLFVGLVVGVILIVGGLQFFPAMALGPIVEHFLMLAGKTF